MGNIEIELGKNRNSIFKKKRFYSFTKVHIYNIYKTYLSTESHFIQLLLDGHNLKYLTISDQTVPSSPRILYLDFIFLKE